MYLLAKNVGKKSVLWMYLSQTKQVFKRCQKGNAVKLSLVLAQLLFTYSKSTIETLEQGVKYVQS